MLAPIAFSVAVGSIAALAAWRGKATGSRILLAAAAAGTVALAAYAYAAASGELFCEDDGTCGSSRGLLRWLVLGGVVAMLVLLAAAGLRALVRPRPFRTSAGGAPDVLGGPLRRSEVFAPDLGLEVRLVIATVLAALVLLVVVAALLLASFTDLWPLVVCIVVFSLAGAAQGSKTSEFGRGRRGARHASDEDVERVAAIVVRLCALAGLKPPIVMVERHTAPLSWTSARPWGQPTLFVTTALLDRLPPPELEAVVAHELSHIANRDAIVMTMVAGPSAAFFRGVRHLVDEDIVRGPIAVLFYAPWVLPVALLMAAIARVVSRHRELTADRGAAMLTGSPAAVAAALISAAGGLGEMRRKDLRALKAGDVFHLLPARTDEPGTLAQLWATHPRLHRRLAQLEELELRLQRARY